VTVVTPITRVVRALRSRRLAVWLLGGLTGWSVLGTLVPQTTRDAAGVARWTASSSAVLPVVRSLGLFDAFRAPIFTAAVAVLFASTVACAWERTRVSLREFRGRRGLTDAQIERLSSRPAIRVEAPDGAARDAALTRVRTALADLRLRARVGERAGEAVGGRFGLLGSPLFHWSLAALCLAVALGQLVRAEGLVGVPVGYRVSDVPEAYGRYEAGPLHPATPNGIVFLASDFQLETVVGGVDHGASAVVSLTRDGAVVARQRVYPNNPLRYGAVLIHQNEFGLAAALRVEDASGTVLASAQPIVDFAPDEKSGTSSAGLEVTTRDGSTYAIRTTVEADRENGEVALRMPERKRVSVSVAASDVATVTKTLSPGDAITLPGGDVLRLVDVVYYARLSVVDDPTVYPIYALFVIAAIGISLAVFSPYRTVRFLLVEQDGRIIVHADARHSRRDPLFAENVEAALREALDAPTAPDATPGPDSPSEPGEARE
jgi:cytochrome c biogenesis protein